MSDTLDRLEIHELFSRYYTAVDAHDATGWTALWTEDGVFDSGHFHFEGKQQLHGFMSQHNAQTRHLVTNVFVEVQGERATAQNYMLVVPTTGKAEVIASAHCRSELRKVEGRWKLARHIYRPDPSFVPPGIAKPAENEVAPGTSTSEQARNKEVVRRATAQLWGQRDVTAIDNYFSPEYVQHNPSAPPGREGVKGFFRMLTTALPDLVVTLDHLYAEGDRVFAFMTWRGTHRAPLFDIPASGQPVTLRTAEIFRFERGLMAEHWDTVDFADVMAKLNPRKA
jgi:uncharacterized protein (TIGR02246 family)